MTTYDIFDFPRYRNTWFVGNSRGVMEGFLLWIWKVCVNTPSRTQVTELNHWGLYPVHVYTSRLLSSGSHGKSRRLTLRIGFFSGSLNGLDYSLRVRVNSLAVELF